MEILVVPLHIMEAPTKFTWPKFTWWEKGLPKYIRESLIVEEMVVPLLIMEALVVPLILELLSIEALVVQLPRERPHCTTHQTPPS